MNTRRRILETADMLTEQSRSDISAKGRLLHVLINDLMAWAGRDFGWDRSLVKKFFQEFGTACAFEDRTLRDFQRFVNEIYKEIERNFAEDREGED